VENQYKIQLNATLYGVLLRSFCIIVLFPLLTRAYNPHQSLSKTAFEKGGHFIYLNLIPFLVHKCGKDSRKPRLRYDTRGLVVTLRFWFRNADNSGVVLSAMSACSLFRWGHSIFGLKINVPMSCRNLRLWLINASGVLLSRNHFALLLAFGSFPEDTIYFSWRGRAKSEFFVGKRGSGPLENSQSKSKLKIRSKDGSKIRPLDGIRPKDRSEIRLDVGSQVRL